MARARKRAGCSALRHPAARNPSAEIGGSGERAQELLASDGEEGAKSAPPAHTTGLLPSQEIRALIGAREIRRISGRSAKNRSSRRAWTCGSARKHGGCGAASCPGRARASRTGSLPSACTASTSSDGAVLEKGCVYVVPLLESLALPSRTSGIANPKSSIGRLDVFTRLITDNSAVFDQVAAGLQGADVRGDQPAHLQHRRPRGDVGEPASSAARQPVR